MKLLKILLGIIMSEVHQLKPWVRNRLEKVVREIARSAQDRPRAKVFVMTVGFTHAGKSTLVESHRQLRNLFRLETDEIHQLLNRNLEFLMDDNTVEGQAYWERQCLTAEVRKRVLEAVFLSEIAVANTSCNLRKKERAKYLRQAERYGYKTIIIWVKCDESALLKCLKEADRSNAEKGLLPAWVDLYKKVQKPCFEIPELSESDALIVFENGKDDPNSMKIPGLVL